MTSVFFFVVVVFYITVCVCVHSVVKHELFYLKKFIKLRNVLEVPDIGILWSYVIEESGVSEGIRRT